jgi:hypothetical protein
MLNNLRNRLPDIEEIAGPTLNRVVNAANSAAQTAKEASGQLEGWAKDGLGSMKTRPLMWGTASLGLGALMGGLFALWRKPKRVRAKAVPTRPRVKTMPARARVKQALRAAGKANGAETVESKPRKKRARKAKRQQPAENA